MASIIASKIIANIISNIIASKPLSVRLIESYTFLLDLCGDINFYANLMSYKTHKCFLLSTQMFCPKISALDRDDL